MSVTRTVSLLAVAAALVAPAVLAAEKANVANGKKIFGERCSICHATTKDPGGPILGPNLAGVVGRKPGSVTDFQMYSGGLKAYGEKEKWNAKTLDKFLKNPFEAVPGTGMPMPVPDDKERADVIAYLVTLK